MYNIMIKYFVASILYIFVTLGLCAGVVFFSSAIHAPFTQNDVVDEQVTQFMLSNDVSLLEEFTPNEVSHLQDVRTLVVNGVFFAIIALIILVSLLSTIKEKIAVYASPLLLLYSIWGVFLVDFSTIFQLFHQTFFPQGNYLFPASSLLITTYSESFFSTLTTIILGATLTSWLLILCLAVLQRSKYHVF